MKKLLFVGIIGVLMAFGLVLAGCDDPYWTCSEHGTCGSVKSCNQMGAGGSCKQGKYENGVRYGCTC